MPGPRGEAISRLLSSSTVAVRLFPRRFHWYAFGCYCKLVGQIIESRPELVGAVDGEGPFERGEHVCHAVEALCAGLHQHAGGLGGESDSRVRQAAGYLIEGSVDGHL